MIQLSINRFNNDVLINSFECKVKKGKVWIWLLKIDTIYFPDIYKPEHINLVFFVRDAKLRRVAILLKNNFVIKVQNQLNDNGGNYIILNVRVETLNCILVNIYGSNTDTPKLYKEHSNKIIDIYSTQHKILGVDYNFVKNKKKTDSMNYIYFNYLDSKL